MLRRSDRNATGRSDRRGIIRSSALWVLCRHRHKAHWSGAEKRLARDLSGRFGDESYAMEELIAELGAAFICADLGITPEPRDDHACYIKNWLRVLKNDKKAIFSAAAKASQASTWLLSREEGAA